MKLYRTSIRLCHVYIVRCLSVVCRRQPRLRVSWRATRTARTKRRKGRYWTPWRGRPPPDFIAVAD